MNTTTKLTEIKEAYSVKRPITNSAGERTYEEKNMIRFKEVNYVDGWARFGHFLLDRIFFYIFLIAIGFMGGILAYAVNAMDIFDSPYFDIITNILTYLVLYPWYYIIFEFSMQSSPGKLVLGRVVVNAYGEKPTFMQIVGRSYARVVPFEVFSCLGTLGWHDTWSDTYVLRKKDLQELKLAIKAQEFGTE